MKECLIGMAILAIAATLLMTVRGDYATPRGSTPTTHPLNRAR